MESSDVRDVSLACISKPLAVGSSERLNNVAGTCVCIGRGWEGEEQGRGRGQGGRGKGMGKGGGGRVLP